MIARTLSGAVYGVDAYLVEVEIDVGMGLPVFNLVGLPDGAVRESKHRVRAALKNAGFGLPPRRVTVNLAPADRRKEGSGFDLAIAVGILAAMEAIPEAALRGRLLVGELSLDGRLKAVPGTLPVTLAARGAGLREVLVPEANASEAAVVGRVDAIGVRTLGHAARYLRGGCVIPATRFEPSELWRQAGNETEEDLEEVRGQEHAKRALEIAAAGGHNILMVGPPGTGKTMLARRIPSILPDLTFDEALEITKIHSIAGLLRPDRSLLHRRPFRSPHPSISDVGLIGGGSFPRPGECSLAHHGVLFLDELPEFKRNALEALRQPVEAGEVIVTRSNRTAHFPCRFMLGAAMNPCRCGYHGSAHRRCECLPESIVRYRQRVSGPLLDRIDIQLEMPAVRHEDLARDRNGEPSAKIRLRVNAARAIQKRRFAGSTAFANAQMTNAEIKSFCRIDPDGRSLLARAMERLGLSARGHTRILKLGRTIADLEGSDAIRQHHLAEAIQYRALDRKLL